jgi:outer membrane receptor protein involved in Fe transport
LEADYGQSDRSDGQDRRFAGAFGTAFANDRGHFTLGLEHQDSASVGCVNVRTWCAQNVALVQNPNAGALGANGQWVGAPTSILVQNARGQITSGGLWYGVFNFPPAPLYAVNDAGNGLIAYNQGVGAQSFSSNVAGGDGRSVYRYTNLTAPVNRNVGSGTLTFAITDTLNLKADFSLGKVETVNRTGGLDATFTSLQYDNAYLLMNPALAAGAASTFVPTDPTDPIKGFSGYTKDWTSQIDSYSRFTTNLKRFSVGLDGRFGSSSWTWDGYYQYGESDRTQLVNDNRHLNAYNFATDAVFVNGVDASAGIECRVTQQIRNGAAAAPAVGTNLYDIAQGCVPLNVLGTSPIDAAAKAYAFGFLNEQTTINQQVLAFNAQGDLYEGIGAGAFQGAAGVEYRHEKGENIGSQKGAPDYVRTDYLIQYGESFAGKVDAYEAYAETSLPLLKGATFAKLLDVDLAARWSRYENTGTLGPGDGVSRSHDLFTWKASGNWKPVDWLRVRASQSRDMRAANFRELYYGQIIHEGGIFGFCGPTGTQATDPCTWSLEGNVDLKPERSDTTTFGLVFEPSGALQGFQFAADYFRIKITDAIQQANVRRVLDGCYVSHLQEYCDLVTFRQPPSTYEASTGGTYPSIEYLRALAFNGSGYLYRGIDFTGSYLLDMHDAGSLAFRLLATRMIEQSFEAVPGQGFVNIVGQVGSGNSFLSDNQPTAKWQANLSTTWQKGAFSSTLQARYVGSGVKNYLGVDPTDANYATAPSNYVRLDDNTVGSYVVFGLNANYRFENVGGVDRIDLWGNVSNLFDRKPPLIGDGVGGTNPIFYDTLGRYYRVGIRMAF